MPTCRPAYIICCWRLILLCAHADMPIYSKIWSGYEICQGEHSTISKVARKLLGHVTMWPRCRTHITWSVWSFGYCSSLNGFSYGILILNFSFGRLLSICVLCGANCNWQYSFGSLFFEYFYGIHADTFYGSVSVLIPHMVYSYGIFYYGSYISNLYIYNYYILYIIIYYIYIFIIYIYCI